MTVLDPGNDAAGEAQEREVSYRMPKNRWHRRLYAVGLAAVCMGGIGIWFALPYPGLARFLMYLCMAGIAVVCGAFAFETFLEGVMLRREPTAEYSDPNEGS